MVGPLKILVGTAILVGFLAVVLAVHFISRRQARGMEPGTPDRVTGEVVTGLMTELRKSQAEAAHWRSAAERLQRELNDRS